MIPHHFVFLEKFPLSTHGKVDRAALALPAKMVPVCAAPAPADNVESRLIEMWTQLLNTTQKLDTSSNFFEIGGNSFSAMRLLVLVQREFSHHLTLAKFWLDPTIKGMASLLRTDSPASVTPLARLQVANQETSIPPIYFVIPAGGTSIFFRHLAKFMGEQQTFYAFEDTSVYDVRDPYASLIEFATDCVDSLLTVEPEGPRVLAGFCYGGIVAFEMAKQLIARGKQVGKLILLDARVTLAHFDDKMTLVHFIVQLSKVFGAFDVIMQKYGFLLKFYRFMPVEKLWQVAIGVFKQGKLCPEGEERQYIQKYMDYFKRHIAHIHNYEVTGKLPCKAIFIHSTEKDSMLRHTVVDNWQSHFTQPIEVYSTKGSHLSMLYEPHVSVLGDILKQVMIGGHPVSYTPPASSISNKLILSISILIVFISFIVYWLSSRS